MSNGKNTERNRIMKRVKKALLSPCKRNCDECDYTGIKDCELFYFCQQLVNLGVTTKRGDENATGNKQKNITVKY